MQFYRLMTLKCKYFVSPKKNRTDFFYSKFCFQFLRMRIFYYFLSVCLGTYTEIFGPKIVNDLEFKTATLKILQGTVKGRTVEVNDYNVEVFRGKKFPYFVKLFFFNFGQFF